jgi:hypothetical protein
MSLSFSRVSTITSTLSGLTLSSFLDPSKTTHKRPSPAARCDALTVPSCPLYSAHFTSPFVRTLLPAAGSIVPPAYSLYPPKIETGAFSFPPLSSEFRELPGRSAEERVCDRKSATKVCDRQRHRCLRSQLQMWSVRVCMCDFAAAVSVRARICALPMLTVPHARWTGWWRYKILVTHARSRRSNSSRKWVSVKTIYSVLPRPLVVATAQNHEITLPP